MAAELFGKPEDQVLFGNQDEAWVVDTLGAGKDDASPGGTQSSGRKRPRAAAPKAAWVDEDDEAIESVDLTATNRLRKLRESRAVVEVSASDFEERLRSRFLATQAEEHSEWAKLPEALSGADGDDDEARARLQSTASLTRTGGRMGPGQIDMIRCKDANAAEPSRSVVRSVAFHPKGEILLTAGLDKTLRFFSIDGTKNAKVDGVFFKDLPISSAAWTGGGDKVVLSGRRPFFYMYDALAGKATKVPGLAGRGDKSLEKLVASPGEGGLLAVTLKDGWVGLVDARTSRLAAELKMNGTARSLCFSDSSAKFLLASGGDADVYTFDLRGLGSIGGGGACPCVSKWGNEGGTPTCGLAMAPTGQLAVAAESGVVNMYSVGGGGLIEDSLAHKEAAGGPARVPWKRAMNLTTGCEALKFSHDGQVLAMASRFGKNALRMMHVGSGTVFSNWPTSKSPLGYVFSLDFSPNSGYFAAGNDKGKVLLYRLKHYSGL